MNYMDLDKKWYQSIFGNNNVDFYGEYLKVIIDIVKKNLRSREIKIVHNKGVLPKELKEFESISYERLSEINNEKNYVIVWGDYNDTVERKLRAYSFYEIKDYIFSEPKPLKITSNANYYCDDRGNEIWNMRENVQIVLKGYGNKIRLPRNAQLGSVVIFAKDHSRLEMKDGALFKKNARIFLRDMVEVYIGQGTFGEDVKFILDTKAKLIIGDGCTFGAKNLFVVGAFHTMRIGDDILTSWNVVFQCSDGHSIFDLSKKEKLNYEKKYSIEQSMILGDHIWIGQAVIVLRNTIIGSGSYMAARSLVRGYYRNNTLIAGTPAKERRQNRAWHRNCFATFSQLDPIYSLQSRRLTSELPFNRIVDFSSYCKHISKLKDIVCVIAVRDIIGYHLGEKELESLSKIGVECSFDNKGWRSYIFISDGENKIFEYITEDEDVAEYTGRINENTIHVISSPLHKGNKAVIELDGKNYATNYKRGWNFVLFEKSTMAVIDSVEFDTHLPNIPCHRKLLYV